jgi:hypothetical protein
VPTLPGQWDKKRWKNVVPFRSKYGKVPFVLARLDKLGLTKSRLSAERRLL